MNHIYLLAGLQDLGWVDPEREDLKMVFVALILVITLFATISVVSGLSIGIKTLANIGFGLGNLILFLCFAMEKTSFLLNLVVQTTGVYLQYNIFKVPFWTDAFGELNEGEGRAVDGNSSATWFIGDWTVFYMAWWVAWACFVGMFIARISKNRTIREVVVSVFICPTIYAIIWFSFMGGIGLRQQRQAMELQKVGEESFQDLNHFLADDSEFCYDVPQEDITINGTAVFTNHLLGITPVCLFDRNNDAQAWFNVSSLFLSIRSTMQLVSSKSRDCKPNHSPVLLFSITLSCKKL
jgi:choline-glycine betaine transporter